MPTAHFSDDMRSAQMQQIRSVRAMYNTITEVTNAAEGDKPVNGGLLVNSCEDLIRESQRVITASRFLLDEVAKAVRG